MGTSGDAGDLGVRGLRQRGVERRRGSGASHTVTRGAGGSRLVDAEPVGEWIRILRVGRPAGFGFTAGQYLRISCQGSATRKFSIASAPEDDLLEFCIGLNPTGRVTPQLFSLEPGSAVELAESAAGSFGLDSNARVHVMVATTTGIAPIRSMVRSALRRGTSDRFTIIHGASRPDDLPYRDEMEALSGSYPGLAYLPTVSRPQEASSRGWAGATGRVERHVVAHLESAMNDGVCVYACGNGAMVSNVRGLAAQRGLAVRTESFD